MTPAKAASGARVPGGEAPGLQWFCAALSEAQPAATAEVEDLLQQAAVLASSAAVARQTGDEATADAGFRRALNLATEALDQPAGVEAAPWHGRVARAAICLALNCGEVAHARRLLATASSDGRTSDDAAAWAQLRDVDAWPEAWLVAAVRGDPPDAPALEALANRCWKPLFGRCELLTLNRERAADLAQEAWRKVLRNRRALKPGGNFSAYLNTIATNLWRDWHRANRRAGAMAEDRLVSLDATVPTADGGLITLGAVVPDLDGLSAEARRALMLDIDHALGQLTPHLREVLIARFLNEESCAEIGRRHGRTEQTVSGWVREAARQMKHQLETARPSGDLLKEPL